MESARSEVQRLLALGPLPSESDDVAVDAWQHAIESLPESLTSDEARALLGIFGRDGCFGLAQLLVAKLEQAEPFVLPEGAELWIAFMRRRVERYIALAGAPPRRGPTLPVLKPAG